MVFDKQGRGLVCSVCFSSWKRDKKVRSQVSKHYKTLCIFELFRYHCIEFRNVVYR